MTDETEELSVGEAASRFLATLTSEEQAVGQSDVNRFVRWFGSQQSISDITPAQVEKYAEQLSQSDTDYSKKLETVKTFLTAAKKEKWTKTNLSTSIKLRKTKTKPRAKSKPTTAEPVFLTPDGYAQLQAELATLRNEQLLLIEEIRRAAADKDFRENVPFHAARERKGHVEGRIIELEATLKSASIMGQAQETSVRVSVGDTIILCDVSTGEECRYMLVSPREVDLARGKISSASPIGQAVLGKGEGDTAEVAAPVGKLHYRIKRIE